MADALTLGPVHHITLRVTQLDRSIAFYQTLCGLRIIAALPYGTILSNGAVILGLCDQPRTGCQDRFDEFRVGLDRLSFTVGSRAELDRAVAILDQQQVPHGEIEDMGRDFGLYVLAFRDPDNIPLELTARYST
jgi:glyoxylase I family protein